MAFNKNKFCQELISNNVKLFENKDGNATQCILHIQKLNIINNPKIICDYIKDQYFKNVLSIKHKGLYLYNMLFKKNNKILWNYLFDETKMLFFLYREIGKNNYIQQIKFLEPRCDFNNLMKNIKHYFYQTAPNTELGDHLADIKNKDGCFNRYYYILLKQRWIKKRKWNNKMEAHLSKGGFVKCIKDFNTTFKNFNYVNLKGKTPQGMGWYNQDDFKGTHFDYLFNLKKSCLVWDCNKDDFRKERIDDFATYLAYEQIGEEALDCVGRNTTLQNHFNYIKKEFGNHFLYNVAKKNMERWWRDKHKCWLSNGQCYKCGCDIVYKCSTEQEAKELEGTNGTCKKCSTSSKMTLIRNTIIRKEGNINVEFFPTNPPDESDSDSGVSDSDSD
jgi:hypothetical protein